MAKAVDPLLASMLLSQVLRFTADMQDRINHGVITDDDINKMLALIDGELDAWEAQVAARRNP